ncbi:hypothetical protein ACWN8P_09960 [Vagococcus salmoninarum]|uniref:DUF3298 domain-containing protein n=1 Tax=Vagococcus salmoninarum TaxID=2739 RepID=A0A429ZK14_9ENTE|nr:hypothetical protein [Vagococcus salmoninarum]RST93999.1 hypothetical protein CBF35_11125 [Vagococcus salmoninarum]
MKKSPLKIWPLGIISLLLLSACRQGERQPSQISEATNNSLSSVNETSQESTEVEAVSGASVTRRLYQEQIPYPHFTNIANAEGINNAILSYLDELSHRLIFDEGTSLDYVVLFENADFISILFEGSTIHGAYPREVKESLNLNLREMERAQLKEIIAVDEQLTALIASQLSRNLQELGTTYEAAFNHPLGELLVEISQDDSLKGQFVFTSEELTLYLSVQHALGDYLEVRIPLEMLARSL